MEMHQTWSKTRFTPYVWLSYNDLVTTIEKSNSEQGMYVLGFHDLREKVNESLVSIL